MVSQNGQPCTAESNLRRAPRRSDLPGFAWLTCGLFWGLIALSLGAAGPAHAERRLDWYDWDSQSMKPTSVAPLVDPPAPRDWVRQRRSDQRSSNWQFPRMSEWMAELLKGLSWAVLFGLALWFCVFLLRRYQHMKFSGPARTQFDQQDQVMAWEKLPDLPRDAVPTDASLLEIARRKYTEQDFGLAMVYLFGYQLLQLDKYQRIRLWKGKTNRQYLQEIRQDTRLRDLLAQSIVAFEDYYFGDYEISQQRFEACWNRLDEFHTLLEGSA